MQKGFLGIDGCRGGWIAVHLSTTDRWHVALVKESTSLRELVQQNRLSLIDIPMGLLDSGGPHRQCDQYARRELGMPRAASVFSAPCRAAVYAKSYDQACRLNFKCLGKKLSKQTWNITDKIRQLDELLQIHPELHTKLRECHPEVAFWALNHSQAMQNKKKEAQGREQRLHVLSRHLPTAWTIVDHCLQTYRRKEVVADDIVDAMALAVTAKLGHKQLQCLPPHPPLDDRGLAMEIVFWQGELTQ